MWLVSQFNVKHGVKYLWHIYLYKKYLEYCCQEAEESTGEHEETHEHSHTHTHYHDHNHIRKQSESHQHLAEYFLSGWK